MKIEVARNITRFYMKKKEEFKLVSVLQKSKLKKKPYNWSIDGFYYINEAIAPELKEDLQKRLNSPFESSIVKGFYGCPITGIDFSWK